MRLSVFLLTVLLSNGVSISLTAEETQRPNILFAFADDWGRFAGAYAETDGANSLNEIVQTPNFDKVAAQGVLFRNAFVNAPSCTPCRSSLLSGQHFWRTGRGAILQGAVWDDSIPVWPLMLQKSGYHIGKTYKVWSPGIPADAPYGARKNVFQAAGGKFNGFSQTASRIGQGKTADQMKETLFAEVRGNFQDFLDGQGEKPFCYWFGPTNVHRKWVKGSGKKLWGIDPDDLKGRLPPFLPDVPVVREDLADYLGEVAAFDTALGILIGELKAAGKLENTIIVVSGDHGAPGFPHGKCNLYTFGTQVCLAIAGPGVVGDRVVDDFVTLPDLAPTFLETGDLDVPDVMTAKSLWPILKSDKSGQVDAQRDHVMVGRERHVAIARAGNMPYPQRAIHTKDHLLVVNFRPDRYPLGDPYLLGTDKEPKFEQMEQSTFVTLPDEDAGPTKAWIVTHRNEPKWKFFYDHAYGKRPKLELFDLKKDPHQMHNVAADPDYASVLNRLNKQLMSELAATHDPRLVDNGAFFENPPMAGPIPDDAKRPRRNR
jgi:N-sulfoglucosamine sulfohydrolase